MPAYARGKLAWGICDRTGQRYPLNDLVDEFVNGVKTGFRVGRDVADSDHPQNFTGRVRTDDAQTLRDPRPDTAVESLHGYGPVWNPAQYAIMSVGRVTVTTS